MASTTAGLWRVTLQAGESGLEPVKQTASRFSGSVDALTSTTVVCYFDAEADGRRALDAEAQLALVGYVLARWDDERGVWTTVAEHGQVQLRQSLQAGEAARAKAKAIRLVAFSGVCFVLVFVVSYLIPGGSGTPNAGTHHDVVRAFGLAITAAVVCPLTLYLRGVGSQ